MTPERWQQVKDVVGRALDIAPGHARDALIDAACAADAELRDEVVSLLAAAEIADSLPGARAAVAAAARDVERDRAEEGRAADADLRRVLEPALAALEKLDPRKARVVELRYFGGLSVEESAEVLKVSADTVGREWRRARAFLLREIERK